MGQTLPKIEGDSYVPEDFTDDCLECIFLRLRKEDLLNVMLVCRRFYDVVNSTSFSLKFCQANGYTLPPLEWRRYASNSKEGPFDYRRIYEGFDPYGSICPENYFVGRLSAEEANCGDEGTFNDTNQFGPFQRVCRSIARETPPKGLVPQEREDEVPPKFDTCLATSYFWGSRTYSIDLIHLGIEEWVLDHARPRITIEEWTAPRFDCASEYRLTATLLKNGEVYNEDLQYPSGRRGQLSREYVQWAENIQFERNELVLENYSFGVRTLVIESRGKDKQFWRGNYGCKFAGLTIRFELPNELRSLQPSDFEDEHIPPQEDYSSQRLFRMPLRSLRVPLFRGRRGGGPRGGQAS